MEPAELLAILAVAGRLKKTDRHCTILPGRQESVADHSWRISLMAMLLAHEFPEADMNKVTRMCLIHDLGEAFTGDIPSFYKTEADVELEDSVLEAWVKTFPEPERSEWLALYDEMNALQTTEAKIYKALDKLEAVISHDESDISTWLPLEYDLQLQYGKENVAFSPYFQRLKRETDAITEQKIRESGEGENT
ncbi:MAG: HD domain-containing protein [Oscillospiraceae bacterium]|nr:HD domain-containing protein [Oscillospiraceae bacterium]